MRLYVSAGLYATFVLSAAASVDETFNQLTGSISATTTYLNTVQGDAVCNFKSTTQAISEGAQVTSGSACPAADVEASRQIAELARQQQSLISLLKGAGSSGNQSQLFADFQRYADAYYALFNALDLWECRIIATPASGTYAEVFGKADNLKDGFNGIAAELAKTLGGALKITGADLKQQTHFAGTSLLATQVDSAKPVALAACKIITAIVEAEGGGVKS